MNEKNPFDGTADTNPFGGANVHGLYVPMSPDEQEVLLRIREADDLEIIVHGWGMIVSKPIMLPFGDHRVALQFRLTFTQPVAPTPVYFFDLELKTISTGISLLKQRYPITQGGKPVQVCDGISLDLQWDIAIDHMSPALVKAIKPGALGLTTRRLDRETGDRTLTGNMILTDTQLGLAQQLDQGSVAMKRDDQKKIVDVTKKAG